MRLTTIEPYSNSLITIELRLKNLVKVIRSEHGEGCPVVGACKSTMPSPSS